MYPDLFSKGVTRRPRKYDRDLHAAFVLMQSFFGQKQVICFDFHQRFKKLPDPRMIRFRG